jgi:hypothetical protein
MRWRRWAGEVVNLIHFDAKGLRHIMADELEIRQTEQVLDVALIPREEVVSADNIMPSLNQSLTKMRPKKTRATSYKYPFAHRRLKQGVN